MNLYQASQYILNEHHHRPNIYEPFADYLCKYLSDKWEEHKRILGDLFDENDKVHPFEFYVDLDKIEGLNDAYDAFRDFYAKNLSKYYQVKNINIIVKETKGSKAYVVYKQPIMGINIDFLMNCLTNKKGFSMNNLKATIMHELTHIIGMSNGETIYHGQIRDSVKDEINNELEVNKEIVDLVSDLLYYYDPSEMKARIAQFFYEMQAEEKFETDVRLSLFITYKNQAAIANDSKEKEKHYEDAYETINNGTFAFLGGSYSMDVLTKRIKDETFDLYKKDLEGLSEDKSYGVKHSLIFALTNLKRYLDLENQPINFKIPSKYLSTQEEFDHYKEYLVKYIDKANSWYKKRLWKIWYDFHQDYFENRKNGFKKFAKANDPNSVTNRANKKKAQTFLDKLKKKAKNKFKQILYKDLFGDKED